MRQGLQAAMEAQRGLAESMKTDAPGMAQLAQMAGGDPSEAGIEVLDAQLASREPLMPHEMAAVLLVDSGMDIPIKDLHGQLVERIQAMAAGE
jgi:hypothetical protein